VSSVMRVSRASIEFCVLMLLGVVLFTTAFLFFADLPDARIDAIESRFAPQIERLREIALTDTRLVSAARVEQMEMDREVFAVPGILSAEAEFSENGWREHGPGLYPVGWRGARRPAPNRPVLEERVRRLGKAGKLETLAYVGVVVRPDGRDHEYRILFGVGELSSR
jgi:hypothetical protein